MRRTRRPSGPIPGALAVCCALLAPGLARAQTPPASSCPADATAQTVVFYDPPCDFVAGPYAGTEARALQHLWPLPGGAAVVAAGAGLGTCHVVLTVKHPRGRIADMKGAEAGHGPR